MIITENNFLLYCAQNYNNESCTSTEEFIDDVKRIKYLRKLFGQYRKTGNINERLVMNHLVILYNVFTARACTRILFFKLEDYLDVLKPFLVALGYLPEWLDGIKDEKFVLVTAKIPEDPVITEKIKQILREGK